MGTRKRGTTTLTADELTIERNKRARAAQEDKTPEVETAEPPSASPPAPDLPPVPTYTPVNVSTWNFAEHRLIAEAVARMAIAAGTLSAHTSEAEAVYIVMRGFEMNVPPFRALQMLYLATTEDGGKEIVEEASLMREQVARSGLGVIEPIPEKCNGTTATVRAIRHDRFGHRHAEFTYTLNDATVDGLMLKRNWQSGANREGLLTARATSKAKRAWFEDVEGARYTHDDLGGVGAAPGEGIPAGLTVAPTPPSHPPTPAPVAPPAVAAADAAGASDAGGPHPPVAPPPGAAAAHTASLTPPSPPPPRRDGPRDGATRQEKMAYYADVSREMARPWTANVGMSRDQQPVPIITHGVTTDQITMILNYTVKGRMPEWTRADEALGLVIDHLGTLGIDTEFLPAPYCFFALTADEADKILAGLTAFARAAEEGGVPAPEPEPARRGLEPPAEVVVDPPPNPHDTVQDGQTHSWTQANDYLEAVLRRNVMHATRADVLGMMHAATGKEFYEMSADELYGAAADLDRLGKNPTILKQAIDRMRVARGSS